MLPGRRHPPRSWNQASGRRRCAAGAGALRIVLPASRVQSWLYRSLSGRAVDACTPVLSDGERDMFVCDQPPIVDPPAADGRTDPDRGVESVLAGAAVEMKHMSERDIPAHRNLQVVGFQADRAVIFVKPSLKVPPDGINSRELGWGHDIEIDDAGSIERH